MRNALEGSHRVAHLSNAGAHQGRPSALGKVQRARAGAIRTCFCAEPTAWHSNLFAAKIGTSKIWVRVPPPRARLSTLQAHIKNELLNALKEEKEKTVIKKVTMALG